MVTTQFQHTLTTPTKHTHAERKCQVTGGVGPTCNDISPEDIAFVFISFFFVYFISKVALPTLHSPKEPTVFNPQNKLLLCVCRCHHWSFPPYEAITYIFHCIFKGHKDGIKAATCMFFFFFF